MKQQDLSGIDAPQHMAPAQLELRVMAGKKHDEAERRSAGKVGLAFDPIAAALRQMHDEVASEEIPDDFLRLLDEIDDRVKARKQAK